MNERNKLAVERERENRNKSQHLCTSITEYGGKKCT